LKIGPLVHIGSSPSCLSGLVTATANMPVRKRLRSADTNRLPPDFSLANDFFTPKAWNELPTELQDLTDHKAFRRKLKTFCLNVRT